jgi:hypothetical protein
LGRVEAAGAVECRDQLVSRGELSERDQQRVQHRNRQDHAEAVVPAQQAVTDRSDGDASRPQEPGEQTADNPQRRADARGVGTACTADKTRPDTPELDDD